MLGEIWIHKSDTTTKPAERQRASETAAAVLDREASVAEDECSRRTADRSIPLRLSHVPLSLCSHRHKRGEDEYVQAAIQSQTRGLADKCICCSCGAFCSAHRAFLVVASPLPPCLPASSPLPLVSCLGKGRLDEDSGFAHFDVEYLSLVFRPFKNEILLAKVHTITNVRPHAQTQGQHAGAQRGRKMRRAMHREQCNRPETLARSNCASKE